MVSHINDKSVTSGLGSVPTTPSVVTTGSGAQQPSLNQPAVRIGLSESSKIGQQSVQVAIGKNDSQLVQEIKNRLNNGTFEIDYESVGQGMLRDLVARVTTGTNSGKRGL